MFFKTAMKDKNIYGFDALCCLDFKVNCYSAQAFSQDGIVQNFVGCSF